jgi:hypothetical protein
MTDTQNPLPKADENSQLQRQSIVSFQKVLPVHQFVFRDERVDDAGVDGSLEILVDRCYTNMRAQVQLKSCEAKKARQDGVVTLPIEASNVNYLLNGPLGLYVLYVKETNELFYEWAADENRRRVIINSDWKSQGEISIPLQVLDEIAIQNIYDRILREARLHREILEALAHAPTNDNISVSISPETLASENSVEIERVLSSTGMTLVAAGYSKLVIEKLNLVSHNAALKPRFNLISAYAYYSTGRYQLALGSAAEALISNSLQEKDKRFAEKIHLACQTNLGIITSEQYFQEMADKTTKDELLYAEVKLQRLVEKLRSQTRRDKETFDEIKELKNKIINSKKSSNSLKLEVRIKCLEAMGFDAVREIFSEMFKSIVKRDSQITFSFIDQVSDLQSAFVEFEEWNKEATFIMQDAINVGHPVFVADALSTRASISLMGLTSKIAFMEFENLSLEQSAIQDYMLLILDWCEKSQKIYKQANMFEGEVRIQLIMAKAFEIMGQMESARNLAQGVFDKAKLFGYKRHIETANEIMSGKTLFSRCIQKIREIRRQKLSNEYDSLTLETKEDIQFFVDSMIEAYQIPEERRRYVEIDVLCMRDIFREKNQWCQHMEIHQNLTHTLSLMTIYAENPNRSIICSKFNYFLDKQSPDWIDLIKDFKEIHCSTCSSKEPSKLR